MKRILPPALLAFLVCACALTGTPTATVTPEAVKTVTPSPSPVPPTATHAPAPVMTGLAMFETGGWGWNGETGALYRSVDAGQTWQPVDLPSGEIFRYQDSAFLDLNTVWLAGMNQIDGSQQLLHTTDGGTTAWTEISPEGLESLAGNFSYHFVNPREGWAEAADAGAGNLYIQMFKTDTGGASYQVVPILSPGGDEGFPKGTVHLCGICSDSFYYDLARVMIVTGDMGSMEPRGAVHADITFDDGKTWKALELPLPEKYSDALVEPFEPAFINEKDAFLPVQLMKISPDGSTTDYRVLVFYISQDGGMTWQQAPAMLEGVQPFPRFQYLDARNIVVLCASAICLTHDGARTWQTFPLPSDLAPTDSRSIMQIDFVNASSGWVVIGDFDGTNSHYSIYKTEDGARTWTLQ